MANHKNELPAKPLTSLISTTNNSTNYNTTIPTTNHHQQISANKNNKNNKKWLTAKNVTTTNNHKFGNDDNVHVISFTNNSENLNHTNQCDNNNENDSDSDVISNYIGHYGRWQFFWTFLLAMFQLPTTFEIFAFVFQVIKILVIPI